MTIKEKAESQINILKDTITKQGYTTDNISLREFNYEFNVTSGKQKVKVQVYFGKKGLKKIIQGDVNSSFYKTLTNIINEQQILELNNTPLQEPTEYIGTDEVGKGDFFGPLVVAAVYVNSESKSALSNLGIRDSKDITDNQIKLFASEIKRITKNKYNILQINPEKYNQLYDKFRNLNKLLDWAHSKAIENLIDNNPCNYVITDKFSKNELSLISKYPEINFVSEAKAEKYIGVAAASILARDSFLNWFRQHSKYGYELPKGASAQVEKYAKALIKKIDDKRFSELAKIHFKTYNRIKNN